MIEFNHERFVRKSKNALQMKEEKPLVSVGLAIDELVDHGIDRSLITTHPNGLWVGKELVGIITNGEVRADKVLAWLGY